MAEVCSQSLSRKVSLPGRKEFGTWLKAPALPDFSPDPPV